MRFFDTISRGRAKEERAVAEETQRVEKSHISELMQNLNKDVPEEPEPEVLQLAETADEYAPELAGSDEEQLMADYVEDAGDADGDIELEFEPGTAEAELDAAIEATAAERAVMQVSPRLAEFRAFSHVNEDMEQQFQTLTERLALSRRTWATMKPYIEQLEVEIRKFDQLENDRASLSLEVSANRQSLDRVSKDLARVTGELAASNSRNGELRSELDQSRQQLLDANARIERLRVEAIKAQSDISYLRSDLAQLTSQLEREVVARESAEQSRQDMAQKYAKLQQVEAQTRHSAIETSLQNDKLMNQLPMLVAEQEKLHNQLRAAAREIGELQSRLMSAQDRVTQLENENQALHSQAASEAYTARTELEMSQASLRTAERAQAELETRLKDLQGQLRDAESWRQSAEYEIAALERDLDGARREMANSSTKLSDLNLKYMTDLLSLDQYREQNKELQKNLEALLTENRRLAKFESLYKAAETQISGLRARFDMFVQSANDAATVPATPMPAPAAAMPSEPDLVDTQQPTPEFNPANDKMGKSSDEDQIIAAQ